MKKIIILFIISLASLEASESNLLNLDMGRSSKEIRKDYQFSALGVYSPLDLWIPNKLGVGLVFQPKESQWALEIEYLRSTFEANLLVEDIGRITDQRLSLLGRSFNGRNSFNFIYGAFYGHQKVELSTKVLSEATGIPLSAIDLIDVKTAGVTWGVGNQWYINDRVIFGIDWFLINIPITKINSDAPILNYVSDTKTKDDVQDVVDVISKVPSFTLLKLQLGVSF